MEELTCVAGGEARRGIPAEPNPAPRDAGAPGCVASGAAGVVAVVGARRGEARSRRVTEAKEVEKGIS